MANILEINGLTTEISGYTILDKLDFSIEENELRVVLGPNGAGKTTLIDMITGRYKPKSGKIVFNGENITRMAPDKIFVKGISRKFQVPNLYETLSVYDNIMVSLKGRRKVLKSLFGKVTKKDNDRIWEILDFIMLANKAEDSVDTLGHGQRQWLELGMLVASEPKLLLLDEPTTGMTEEGKEKTAELIQKIAQTHAVMFVEHDMDIVRKIAKKVTVLAQGQILAEGPLSEVVKNEEVKAVYLGKGRYDGA
ncbi:MAG: ATP-binding cassette domain-containing protein [Gammaproteobacteria bacterium]|nr:ATP-binding cassette domain-containing protein [Gammaproteobacteria bacterium]